MEDRQIIHLYLERNERAIPETAAKYGAYCTKIAQNILFSREDAEECVNDTYLQTWNAIPPQKPQIFSAFLAKIARNLSLSRYRQNTAEKRGGAQTPLVLEELAEVVSGGETPEDVLCREELTKAINDFLAALPRQKRSLFVCRYFCFDSLTELASAFQMTNNNLSVTLSRLRKDLRDYLSERGFSL